MKRKETRRFARSGRERPAEGIETSDFNRTTAAEIAPAPHEVEGCNHTLCAYDDADRLQGSWVEQDANGALRVVCSACGKFYGYRFGKSATAALELDS